MRPQEIRPGLFHWTAPHPRIHIDVSSHWIAPARVLLDPLLPPDAGAGLDWLRQHGPPEHVILTNRHHWRACSEVVAAFGCPVWCPESGMAELEGHAGSERARPFRPGDELPAGIESYEVGVLCPDETALRIPLEAGACLAVADGVVRMDESGGGDAPLTFVPDSLLAEEPSERDAIKDGLRAAYRRLCDLDWDTLLLAHGLPLVGEGREKLRAFARG